MKKLALLFLLALSSAMASAAAKPEKQTLTAEGKERIYYTFVPEKLTAPAPLLLLLHGSGRDGMSQINEWKDLAGKEGSFWPRPTRPIRGSGAWAPTARNFCTPL